MSDVIIARRGNEEREFPRSAWDLLPNHRHGWMEKVELPDELKGMQVQTESVEALPADSDATSEAHHEPDSSTKTRKGRASKDANDN